MAGLSKWSQCSGRHSRTLTKEPRDMRTKTKEAEILDLVVTGLSLCRMLCCSLQWIVVSASPDRIDTILWTILILTIRFSDISKPIQAVSRYIRDDALASGLHHVVWELRCCGGYRVEWLTPIIFVYMAWVHTLCPSFHHDSLRYVWIKNHLLLPIVLWITIHSSQSHLTFLISKARNVMMRERL
jgi:hypothetical protein